MGGDLGQLEPGVGQPAASSRVPDLLVEQSKSSSKPDSASSSWSLLDEREQVEDGRHGDDRDVAEAGGVEVPPVDLDAASAACWYRSSFVITQTTESQRWRAACR